MNPRKTKMVIVFTIVAIVPDTIWYNALQTFYTFDFLYIKGNTISSNRTSMQKRRITVQPVFMHIFTLHICNRQSESTLHMSNVAHYRGTKRIITKLHKAAVKWSNRPGHQRSSGPTSVRRLGKWICTMYMYIHRVVQIEKLIITIILFSIVKYLCIMIRLILFINLYLNPRELTYWTVFNDITESQFSICIMIELQFL